MGKINDSQKALLATQMEHAIVESVGTPKGEPGLDEGYFKVFVPGAIREHNYVSAEDESEAKAKVVKLLESKIDQMSEDEPTGSVEVSPDNLEVTTKGLPPKEIEEA